MDPTDSLRQLERERWREREKKDIEVEARHGPRPLEGWSSGGHTSWMGEQDDRSASEEHAHDEDASHEASLSQVPDR